MHLKSINTGEENLTSPCKAIVSDVYDDGYNINFYVNTLSSYVVEVVEENTEKGTGLEFEDYFNLNKLTFHNEYSDYIKANTNYDIFVRVACGSSFSEYTKVLTYRSPIANVVFIAESSFIDDQLQLSWPDYHYGFNYEYCQSYDQVVYEIEYGLQGFLEGEGVSIEITQATRSGGLFSYSLPLSNFESGSTYEFSIRSVVNGNSRGVWNSLNSGACNQTNKDRFVFTAP